MSLEIFNVLEKLEKLGMLKKSEILKNLEMLRNKKYSVNDVKWIKSVTGGDQFGALNNAFLPDDQRLIKIERGHIFCLTINPRNQKNLLKVKPSEIIVITQNIHNRRYCTHLVTPIDSPAKLIPYEEKEITHDPASWSGRWVMVIAMTKIDILYDLKWPYQPGCVYDISEYHPSKWIADIWDKFQPYWKL
ncbi:MAG: hypothetical protein LBR60_01390 [Fibrobacter sp.]|jgi:hypothetical protein|nr:hypothetical protein [Fibrobacter sp.]